MQKWEYMQITVYGDTVRTVNGEKVAEQAERWFPLRTEGPKLLEFLNEVGDEGWELVFKPRSDTYILKRSKP